MQINQTSKLLFDTPPLVVDTNLAVVLGLNEGIILQQLHYWITKSKHEIQGRKWVFNTYQEWQKQFPFWSINTIKRAVYSLEKKGILISGCFNKVATDKTKWYTIDYDVLFAIVSKWDDGTAQNDTLERTKMDCSNHKNTNTENTTENTDYKNGRDVEDIADYIYYLYNNNIVCSSISKKDMVSIFKYYFGKYEQCYGKKHPYLKKEQLIELINTADYIETENNSAEDITINEYIPMIDRYFEIDTFDYTDRNINHFWSVRANRYYEIM